MPEQPQDRPAGKDIYAREQRAKHVLRTIRETRMTGNETDDVHWTDGKGEPPTRRQRRTG